MNMNVRDLTTPNLNAAFRNDVQISHFRNVKQNLELVKSFIFTTAHHPQKKSSVEVLKRLIDAFVEGTENRFLIRASYGHGKSHLGLVLANYFGKSIDSEEAKALLGSLEHTLNDYGAFAFFRDFKRFHKPFLVLLLRGDEAPTNLRDKFFRALYEALNDHKVLRGVRPSFWFENALNVLESFNTDEAEKAERYLEAFRLDLPTLKKELQERRSDHYGLCVELVKEVKGVKPDFGGEISLSEAINWAVKELCGRDGPLSGVLILFDEFSAYVRDYLRMHTGGTPFQELMNGVEDHRGKVLFVALTQHEPEKVAKNDGSAEFENLLKELNRIPQNNQQRMLLQTTLEDVLRGYFRLNTSAWRDLLRIPGFTDRITKASEITFEIFKEHYQKNLNWGLKNFQEKVTKACFPLHPLTTALLTSVELEAVANRSVLNFITDRDGPVQRKLDQPAVVDGRPNWVLPVELVDYFKESLGEQAWKNYQSVNLPDLSEEEHLVLKAMMLQTAANIPSKGVGFFRLIAELTGLSPNESERVLKKLEQGRYIRYDPIHRIYSLWAGNNQIIVLERMLNKELEQQAQMKKLSMFLEEVDECGSNKATDILNSAGLLEKHEVEVSWGHRQDWAASEVVLGRNGSTVQYLERLAARYTATPDKMPEARGLVVLFLAKNEEEVAFFQRELAQQIDVSFKLRSAPLLFILPDRPTPELFDAILKYTLLDDRVFADKAVKQVGLQIVEEEKKRYAEQIKSGLEVLRREGRLEVPLDSRGKVQALGFLSRTPNRIARALRETYFISYKNHPGEFFIQYRASKGNVPSGVSTLISLLAFNDLSNGYRGLARIPKEIVDQFLQKSTAWGVVNAKLRLQEPSGNFTRLAWERINNSLSAGQEWIKVEMLVRELLNPPYGYDYNTLSLLMAAWLGYYRRDIDLAIDGKITTLSQLVEDRTAKPKDFIKKLTKVSTRRKKRDEGSIRQIIEQIERGGLSREQAKECLAILRARANEEEILDPELLENAKMALAKLEQGLRQLEEYEKKVNVILQVSEEAKTVSKIAQQLDKLKKLNEPVVVCSGHWKRDQLREKLLQRASELTDEQCRLYERIDSITDYGRNEERLKGLFSQLELLSLTEAQNRVNKALKNLETSFKQLKAYEEETQILGLLRSIDSSSNLLKLREIRKELEGYTRNPSERVRAEAQERLEKVRAEIEFLESFVQSLEARLNALSNEAGVLKLERKILELRNRFEGTPDFQDIEAAATRCRMLAEYFRELEAPLPNDERLAAEKLTKIEGLAGAFGQYLSDSQAALACKKAEELKAHVAKLEEKARVWLQEMVGRIDAATEPEFFRELRDELQKALGRYEGSPLAQDIGTVSKRCLELEKRFREVRSKLHFEKPEEAKANRLQLQVLLEWEGWSEAQRKALMGILETLEEKIQLREQKARDWLEARKQAFTQGRDLETLEHEIKNPDPFLDERGRQELAELKNQVAEAINADRVRRIEIEFRRLIEVDPAKAKSCLVQLLQLMEAEERV